MVHGAPDNYQVQQKATTYRLDDMAELAIRLGAIPSIDRLGEVILYNDFSNGLSVNATAGIGTGAAGDITGERFKTAGWSLKLTSGRDTQLKRGYNLYIPYYTISNFGLEVWFNPYDDISYIVIGCSIYDGSNYHTASVKIDIANSDLALYTAPYTYTVIDSNFTIIQLRKIFLALKFVFDIENNKYKRLRISNKTYDISNYGLDSDTSLTKPQFHAYFEVHSALTFNAITYLDSIIITQNEI